ncbi:MAG: hypothetical protein WA777_11990 [Rhodanobacter sp.]
MPKSTLQIQLPRSWWLEFGKPFHKRAKPTRTAEEMSVGSQVAVETVARATLVAAQLLSAQQLIDQQSGLIDELRQQRDDFAAKHASLESRCDALGRDLQAQTDAWAAERIQQERYYASSEDRWQHEVDRAHQETQSLRALFQRQRSKQNVANKKVATSSNACTAQDVSHE